jgi:hypothetical protein
MGAWKDYMKLSILLSPNKTFAYNIVTTFHHHLVKKKFHLECIISLMGRESPIDSRVSNSFFQQLILFDRIYSLCLAPTF